MPIDTRDLLTVLRNELKFLNEGGYAKQGTLHPSFLFEDSPTCLNYRDPARSHSCSGCVLLKFVPQDKWSKPIPCRQIPLNACGETLDGMYRYGTPFELESALRKWLEDRIQELEEEFDPANSIHPG